jgi:NADH dehydrogenase
MTGLDRKNKRVIVAPTLNENGEEIIPERNFEYDILVIAVGSLSNDFGIPGVREHCLFLDTLQQAKLFQQQLLDQLLFMHTHQRERGTQFGVAIIGAGATGVELAAQLHTVTRVLSAYGLDGLHPEDIKLHIIEAGPRILPALPEPVVDKTCASLAKIGVKIHVNERVVEVTKEGVKTASGNFIAAVITVWAAGIKAPDFLQQVDDLESNNINQLVVKSNLQTTRDESIYALGDCAACIDAVGTPVPPRAQAAHQQASFLYKRISRQLRSPQSVTTSQDAYRYRDYGSLVTLGSYSTVGSLMGSIPGTLFVTGFIARMVYLSLYKLHQIALFGFPRTALLTVSKLLRRSVDPEVKLH